MVPLEDLLAEIENGPEGDHIVAFFDMDRTLIYGFSAQDLLVEQLTSGELTADELIDQITTAVQFSRGKVEFDELVREGTRNLRGQLDEKNYEFGERVFKKRIAARIYPEARTLIQAHRKKGHRVVIVSAATPYQVEPVAYDLGVDAFLCTHLEVVNGVCTGKIIEPACYGEGKSVAVTNFARNSGVRTKDCYFYSDGHEDLPLLELVGHPKPLNPDRKLTLMAEERGWPITRFAQRGRTKPKDVLRTSMAYLTAVPAAAAALTDYALNKNVRDARNTFLTVWGNMSHGAIGIQSRIKGEEHLWSHRPAVFIANHQSAADVPVTLRMLRENFTSVGKIEVKNQPIIGQVAQAIGTIFVDRSNHDQAVDALKPAVDALKHDNMSILIFPEGTRSVTNKLGRFKKGAFHIAMQAGVPIVPIVMHNTTDVMPKSAILSRPGTVDVTVLPPIQTKDWKAEDLNDHIEDIRRMFLDELGQSDEEQMVRGAPPVDASLAAGVKAARRRKDAKGTAEKPKKPAVRKKAAPKAEAKPRKQTAAIKKGAEQKETGKSAAKAVRKPAKRKASTAKTVASEPKTAGKPALKSVASRAARRQNGAIQG